jgi:hypothetical protein
MRHALIFVAAIIPAAARAQDRPCSALKSEVTFTVGVAGLGLSLSPRRPGRGTVRLDYGFPLTGTPGVKRTPGFSLTIFPWLESSRHREKSGLL